MSELDAATPTLERVLEMAIEARLLDLHTALPATVVKFDKDKQTVDVKPSLKRKYQDATKATELPVINSVPIVYPRGSTWRLVGPLAVGDSVLLVFSERSLDVWKKNGGTVDPLSNRKHHLTDAFAIPGGYPSTKVLGTVDAAHLRLEHDTGRIEMQAAGKFKIQKVGGEELFDLVIQLTEQVRLMAEKLSTDTTNTMLGPMKLNFFADYAAVMTAVNTIKTKVTGLKGV